MIASATQKQLQVLVSLYTWADEAVVTLRGSELVRRQLANKYAIRVDASAYAIPFNM